MLLKKLKFWRQNYGKFWRENFGGKFWRQILAANFGGSFAQKQLSFKS
jgi:hypothetical protein